MLWTKHTFGHLLEHTEDGAGPDEGLGLEEMHGGREVLFHQLLLLHFKEDGVQPLLGVSQHHPPTGLHGGLQLYEGLSLPGVRVGQSTAQTAQEHSGHGHGGALQPRCHVPRRAEQLAMTVNNNSMEK